MDTFPPRPRRSAAERRAQVLRAEGRVVQRLLSAQSALSAHRGCRQSLLGSALADALHAHDSHVEGFDSFWPYSVDILARLSHMDVVMVKLLELLDQVASAQQQQQQERHQRQQTVASSEPGTSHADLRGSWVPLRPTGPAPSAAYTAPSQLTSLPAPVAAQRGSVVIAGSHVVVVSGPQAGRRGVVSTLGHHQDSRARVLLPDGTYSITLDCLSLAVGPVAPELGSSHLPSSSVSCPSTRGQLVAGASVAVMSGPQRGKQGTISSLSHPEDARANVVLSGGTYSIPLDGLILASSEATIQANSAPPSS